MMMNARNHAAVIGGSIAGLWTARVLADHFDRVTVIDRDHFPDSAEARKGAPQGRQIHVLLVRGQQILDQLFPSLYADMQAEGVSMIHWNEETANYSAKGHWSPRIDYGYQTMACSRLLLEWHMRKLLLQNPKIRFVEGRVVSGVLTNDAKTQITGVQMEAVGAERASVGTETLDADLVVDCSGRESHTPEWLTALGYAAPEETVIDAHVGYATRWYERPNTFHGNWKTILVQQRMGIVSHSSMVYPIENGQWMALMATTNAPPPDTDEAFLEHARSLPIPDVYDALKDAKPISPIYRYQRTANQFRHYETLERLPDGLILIGDAVCAFNPVFGQGMTVSAMEALLLDKQLRAKSDTPGFALRFQKQVGKLIAGPWQLATSEDARNRKKGEKISVITRLFKVYMDHLLVLQSTDLMIGKAFLDVFHLIKTPSSLFAPAVALKVVRHMLTTPLPPKTPTPQAPLPEPVEEKESVSS
jgi:2-polyprenyl-6-methoxyphenol hydroxylase-like FAD-dependent oxidoreductase